MRKVKREKIQFLCPRLKYVSCVIARSHPDWPNGRLASSLKSLRILKGMQFVWLLDGFVTWKVNTRTVASTAGLLAADFTFFQLLSRITGKG